MIALIYNRKSIDRSERKYYGTDNIFRLTFLHPLYKFNALKVYSLMSILHNISSFKFSKKRNLKFNIWVKTQCLTIKKMNHN
jgi:hypothetical protein